MKEPVDVLVSAIEDERMLAEAAFSTIDADALLDDRDSNELFEAQWLRVHRKLEELWKAEPIDDDQVDAVDELREVAFSAAGEASGHHELAAYVSDDFDLIGKALVLGFDDPWLNGLFLVYKNGGVGGPGIEEQSGQLRALV